MMKYYVSALESYDLAIQLKPNKDLAYFMKGKLLLFNFLYICLHFLATFYEALECFNKSIEIDKYNYEYHYYKDQTLNIFQFYSKLFSLQKYEEANQSFEKVIELNLQYFECYLKNGNIEIIQKGETLSQIYLNILVFKLFKYEEAINNFNKAIELYPNNYLAYYYKGIILQFKQIEFTILNKQQFKESLIFYDMAIQINPQFIQSYIQKCIIYQMIQVIHQLYFLNILIILKLQQFEAALININLALEIDNQPELIFYKAKLLKLNYYQIMINLLYLYDDAIIACSIAEACEYDKEQCQKLLQEIEKIKFQQ